MEGRAFGVFWEVVERRRKRVLALEAELRERDRVYTEAWFEVIAMAHKDATPEDKAGARSNLKAANAELEAVKGELETANRRLPMYEEALRACTPT